MYYLNGGDCVLPVAVGPAVFLCLPLTLWSESRWDWGLQGGISPPWWWQGICPQSHPSVLSGVFYMALNLPFPRLVGGFIPAKPWATLRDI